MPLHSDFEQEIQHMGELQVDVVFVTIFPMHHFQNYSPPGNFFTGAACSWDGLLVTAVGGLLTASSTDDS